MKRKLLAFVALMLVCAIGFTLAGCGDEPMSDNVIKGELNGALIAEKVGQIDIDNFTAYRGGLIYQDKETKLYGVMSLEGKHDTGAIFTDCSEKGLNFSVVLGERKSSSSIAEINSAGLIDGKGNVIVPPGFAYFYVLNDRYVQAYRATERTSLLSETLLYLNDNSNVFTSDIGDVVAQYAGEWCVYDTVKGTAVPGIYGTTEGNVWAKGNFVTHKDGDDYVTVGPDGKPAPEHTKMFDDGSYAVEGRVGEVYDTDGNLRFNYDLGGFVPYSIVEEENCYIASKYNDGGSKYVVMNMKGEIISAEFNDNITIYNEVVYCEEKLYDFEGNQVIDGVYADVDFDKMFKRNYMLYQNNTYRLMNADGTVVFTYKEKEADVYPSDFTATKKKDDDTYVYCYADEDFTIKGYSFAPWLAKTYGSNNLQNIVDTISGEILLEGYNKYDYSTFDGTKLYVYAYYNGGADAFIIINEEDLAAVKQKKADLLADLTAAFKAENINIDINAETGEMALDTSVLFGGDSAVITAQGKTFLNKFIKVYHNIAFSEKYAGFISKTLVEGHIAPVKGSTYASGLPLSEERANNVLNYCLSKETGVNLSKFAKDFEAIGYSNSQPIYGKDGKVNMAASRRVSFRFMISIEMI